MGQYTNADSADTPRCACRADRHVPTGGCLEDAVRHPEGDDPMPCGNCAPFEAIGRHLGDFPAPGFGRMTRAEREEANADRELVADETGGRGFDDWAPGELTEAWGR